MLSSIHQGCYRKLVRYRGGFGMAASTSHLARTISTDHARQKFASEVAATPSTPPVAWPKAHIEPGSEFWRKVPKWMDVSSDDFSSWNWSVKKVIETKERLFELLYAVLPDTVPRAKALGGLQSREEFITDVSSGIRRCSMSVRVMPYMLSLINWSDPANDPIFRQFIPLRSIMMDDHPVLDLDSLNEQGDTPVRGIVHRYPDKALFLPTHICPTNCIFCTRSYGVGASTELVTKKPLTLSPAEIDEAMKYIESQEGLHDIVISGGDSFYLQARFLEHIGDRLIGMKNVERFRVATKGLAVAPFRFLDDKDQWAETLIRVADKARMAGKHMALHTHFNHPNEISWITEQASLKLLQSGVTVRNQTVLLRGVNDSAETMVTLIKKLAKMSIQPYYVYQCDMVPAIEHFRTPLQTILDIEAQIQGEVAGFYLPKFVVDLPGGGGKRPAYLYESYDRESGVSTFTQPALKGKGRDGRVYKYYDPIKT